MFKKSDVRRWSARQIRATPSPSNAWRIGAVIVTVIAALLYALNTRAQDVTFAGCEAADYDALQAALSVEFDRLTDDPAGAVLAMRSALDTTQLKCSGGVVTKQDYPDGIFGPIVFDGTVYQFSIEAPQEEYTYTALKWTAMAGDCDLIQSVDIPGDGGKEVDIVEFEGCTALFEVDSNATDWTVTITKVK